MTDDVNGPEKKLFVDEDWKSRVEREKEEALRVEPGAQSSQDAAGSEKTSTGGSRTPLPSADLLFLIGTLYLQGAMALGLLPNPISNKAEVHYDQAKHAIDLLAVLQQKTEGNRTADETEELDGALHQLRMAYLAVSENAGKKN